MYVFSTQETRVINHRSITQPAVHVPLRHPQIQISKSSMLNKFFLIKAGFPTNFNQRHVQLISQGNSRGNYRENRSTRVFVRVSVLPVPRESRNILPSVCLVPPIALSLTLSLAATAPSSSKTDGVSPKWENLDNRDPGSRYTRDRQENR